MTSNRKIIFNCYARLVVTYQYFENFGFQFKRTSGMEIQSNIKLNELTL